MRSDFRRFFFPSGTGFSPPGARQEILSISSTAWPRTHWPIPAVRSRLINLGLELFAQDQQTPETLGGLVKADVEKWWPIIKDFGINGQ